MKLSGSLSRLRDWATGGNIMQYIQLVIIASILALIGTLWLALKNTQAERDLCHANSIKLQTQLDTVTRDLTTIKEKQEIGVQQREAIADETIAKLNSISKKLIPMDCKDLAKWAAKNKSDTRW